MDYDIAFFEAFQEEAMEIRRHLPPEFRAFYTENTIQDERLPDLIAPEWNAFLNLRDDPRVLFTPHNAFNSHEAVIRKSVQSIEQYLHFQTTGKFTNPVPADS